MHRQTTWLVSLVLVVPLLGACVAEDVSDLRRNYEAEVVSIVLPETPAPVEPEPAAGEEMEASLDETEAGADGGIEETDLLAQTEPVEVDQKVFLDIRLRRSGAGKLPGVTLDITQADGDGNRKAHWRRYVETEGMAVEQSVSVTLDDVDYEPGDGFHAEVLHTVPPEQRSEYQEFSEQTSS